MNVDIFYENVKSIYIPTDKLLDRYEKTFDSDESIYLTYKNISYNLPSGSTFYKNNCIDKEVLDLCEVVEVASYSDLVAIADTSAIFDHFKIYKITGSELSFILRKLIMYGIGTSTQTILFDLVDQFKKIEDESSDDEASFKIIPAEVYASAFYEGEVVIDSSHNWNSFLEFAIPKATNANQIDEKQGLTGTIQDGIGESAANNSNIFIAFYLGLQKYILKRGKENWTNLMGNLKYPMCAVTPYIVSKSSTNIDLYQIAPLNYTLSLAGAKGLNDRIYSKNLEINTTLEHVINFLDNKVQNPMLEFVIDNKKYYCKELHYKIKPSGISQQVEGTFYPM